MDVVVTVPKRFTYHGAPGEKGLAAWIAEGDPAGEEWSGTEWEFCLGLYAIPSIEPGERVYIVCENHLRGYAPLIRMEVDEEDHEIRLIRAGGAVAITLPHSIRGFQGFRYRWWAYEDEIPFPDWRDRRG